MGFHGVVLQKHREGHASARRWLVRRRFPRSTRWLMWSWTTGSITGDHERATGFHGVISINFGFWAELALYRRDAATRSDSALICGCF